MDINSFIRNMSKDNIKQISKIVNTKEGQELMEKLKGIDKSQLMKRLSSVDDNDLPREELIGQITKNPELIKKLNDFLDRK
ncbi:MAG: hypothetical protein BWY15_00770 [Firmicutes bacterium ADurb.Bin193]|nr:MAG: hypothetical protein BWY15_00770 [Firmicutes bacterium ADurb.Bin193]